MMKERVSPASDPLSTAVQAQACGHYGADANVSPARASRLPTAPAAIPHGGGVEDIVLQIAGPDGGKTPLKVRLSDDVATLRALITQMYVKCVAGKDKSPAESRSHARSPFLQVRCRRLDNADRQARRPAKLQ